VFQSIIVNKESNGTGRITLNRAEIHNAFDDTMISELTQAIVELDEDDQVRLLVLQATGKSFCAGADLNWMKKMANYSRDENYQDSVRLATLMHTLYQCSKPTVALCQGAAFGGGVGLVSCADIVLASDKAKFCLSEVKLGLIPAVISPFVVKALGERQAKRYFISAEIFDARTAQQLNLVHQVWSADDFTQKSNEYIANLLQNGPTAQQQAKQLVDDVVYQPIDKKVLELTANRIADVRASKEGQEGISAFLEKRKPNWQK